MQHTGAMELIPPKPLVSLIRLVCSDEVPPSNAFFLGRSGAEIYTAAAAWNIICQTGCLTFIILVGVKT